MKKELLSVLIVLVMLFTITGCDLETTESNEQNNNTNTQQETKTEEQQETKKENKTDDMDLLRKCTVMEAADLYTTGGAKTGENVFDKGKETCLQWYKEWSEKDFAEAVTEDWNNRQNEEIEGKTLSYYLDTLGW